MRRAERRLTLLQNAEYRRGSSDRGESGDLRCRALKFSMSRPSLAPPSGRFARRAAIRLAATLALVSGLLGAVSAASAAPLPPDQDPFYLAPAGLGELAPGTPIRTRELQIRGASSGTMYDATQVLYRSTDAQSQPIATVATVILPKRRPASGSPHLVSYQQAYDGLGPRCRPSYTMRLSKPPVGGDVGGVELNLKQGWAVVVADYEGPTDAWIAGYIAGHATLDGIRAAQALPRAGLAGSKVGLQGYSGGGHATAWANELAGQYAPELDIVGAVQGGVPADPRVMYRGLNGSLFTGVLLAAIQGIARSEPEVQMTRHLNPLGQAVWKNMRRDCLADFALKFPFLDASLLLRVKDLFSVPEIKAAADKNTLGQRRPSVPTWMWHARADEAIPYAGAKRVAEIYCAKGATLRFDTYKYGEHVTGAIQSATQQVRYLRDRFAGLPPPTNC